MVLLIRPRPNNGFMLLVVLLVQVWFGLYTERSQRGRGSKTLYVLLLKGLTIKSQTLNNSFMLLSIWSKGGFASLVWSVYSPT